MSNLFKELAEEFKDSPIGEFSLSSKELFHSNFLSFLLRNYSDFCKWFLNDENVQVAEVVRESEHIDIKVKTCGCEYWVENKVKSLPDSDQLSKYKEKAAERQPDQPEVKFIYLTLIEPDTEFKGKHKDISIRLYEGLRKFLKDFKTSNEYHNYLINDYLILLDLLLKIKDEVSVKCLQTEKLSLTPDMIEMLQGIRMYDVAQKIRFSCFMEEIKSHLNKKLPDLMVHLRFGVGMTRSLALIDIKYSVLYEEHEAFFGIQIQGNQYRRMLEKAPGGVVSIIELADELNNRWWLTGDAPRGRTGLNGFGNTVRYRYTVISNLTLNKILDKITNDLRDYFVSKTRALPVGKLSKNLQLPEIH